MGFEKGGNFHCPPRHEELATSRKEGAKAGGQSSENLEEEKGAIFFETCIPLGRVGVERIAEEDGWGGRNLRKSVSIVNQVRRKR